MKHVSKKTKESKPLLKKGYKKGHRQVNCAFYQSGACVDEHRLKSAIDLVLVELVRQEIDRRRQ